VCRSETLESRSHCVCAPEDTSPAQIRNIIVSESFGQLIKDTMRPPPTPDRRTRFMILIVDNFTKWAQGFAVSNADIATVAQLLVEEINCCYVASRKLLSGGGLDVITL